MLIKRVLLSLISIVLTASIVSCSDGGYSHAELRIALTEDFYSVENESFDKTYSNGKEVVAILRMSFEAGRKEGISEFLTPFEFGKYWTKKCKRDAEIKSGGVPYCTYYDGTGEDKVFYYEAFYRSGYAYFVVLFATSASNEAESAEKFAELAESVYFKK